MTFEQKSFSKKPFVKKDGAKKEFSKKPNFSRNGDFKRKSFKKGDEEKTERFSKEKRPFNKSRYDNKNKTRVESKFKAHDEHVEFVRRDALAQASQVSKLKPAVVQVAHRHVTVTR